MADAHVMQHGKNLGIVKSTPINPVIQTAMRDKSDTPKTDAQMESPNESTVPIEFARELERENATMKKAITLLRFAHGERTKGEQFMAENPSYIQEQLLIEHERLTEAESMLAYLGYDKCPGTGCKCGGYHARMSAKLATPDDWTDGTHKP